MTTKTRRAHWNAMFCEETRDEIVERMQELLGGGRYFAEVHCNSYSEDDKRGFTAVDVHPSLWLTTEVRSYTDPAVIGITWATPMYASGVHTNAKTQAEGRDGGKHDFVHFTFDHDRIVIDHYAPVGNRLRWIYAVERHDREEQS